MDRIRETLERRSRTFRTFAHNSPNYLGTVAILSMCLVVLSFAYAVATKYESYRGFRLVTAIVTLVFICYIYFLAVYIKANIRDNRNDPNPNNDANHLHNMALVQRDNGRIMVLAIFTALDSTLKESNGILSVIFCISLFIHLVHIMVIFRFVEDHDLCGNFLAASFGLIFEKTTTWWQVILLIIVTGVLSSFKSILLEGRGAAAPRRH